MFHIAQINIARMVAPLESPIMKPFVERLSDINALADTMPGFVWRLQTPSGDATLLRIFDDDRLIINMSLWDSIEALWDFSYKTAHVGVMSRRTDWFEKMTIPHLALWWIPVGSIPAPEEGKARLKHLELNGVTSEAFTFKARFPMPQTHQSSS